MNSSSSPPLGGEEPEGKRLEVHLATVYGLEPPVTRSVSMAVHALKSSKVANLRSKVSPEEWQARVDLAAAYRLIDL
jgi:hypothetical protein